MVSRLHVGCPMWANRAWVGPYFPPSTRSGEELAQYASWCNAVEGNTTFYAAPSADTVRRWNEVTPPSFEFMFKLPQRITHELRLRGAEAELTAFMRLMEPLHERVGSFSIQLPASFGPGDIGVLAAFLRRAPSGRGVRWSAEVRHRQFFDGGPAHQALTRLLRDTHVERIILDSRTLFSKPPIDEAERQTWSQKPRLPVDASVLTDRPIVRYIGRTADAETIAGWQAWIPVVVGWIAAGKQPTFFVHTPDNSTGLELARRFHAAVAAVQPGIEPLPTPTPREMVVAQGSLFDMWGDR